MEVPLWNNLFHTIMDRKPASREADHTTNRIDQVFKVRREQPTFSDYRKWECPLIEKEVTSLEGFGHAMQICIRNGLRSLSTRLGVVEFWLMSEI
jgi:hypothetical protein